MIRQLRVEDTKAFCELIVDMYGHLENLEWFSPMPYDYDNVKSMIENDRFYIIGCFDGDTLCAVSSLDYKCGKLIGKIDFPKECNLDSIVEIGFNMVHSNYRGKGLMKLMVANLLDKIEIDGFMWAFSKAHKDNFASLKSLQKNGFEKRLDYQKPVKRNEFEELSSQDFFSENGKKNAKITLSKLKDTDDTIIVDYNILIKKV
ncbi:MAG: GNAT family N-acetyltransferase [Clostridia bacterium]|nr:GNAT family N-acetyltransferase [Clostridia bacterium]